MNIFTSLHILSFLSSVALSTPRTYAPRPAKEHVMIDAKRITVSLRYKCMTQGYESKYKHLKGQIYEACLDWESEQKENAVHLSGSFSFKRSNKPSALNDSVKAIKALFSPDKKPVIPINNTVQVKFDQACNVFAYSCVVGELTRSPSQIKSRNDAELAKNVNDCLDFLKTATRALDKNGFLSINPKFYSHYSFSSKHCSVA